MAGAWRVIVLVGLVAACSSAQTGEVRLAGQFTPEAPPPAEVRVMLDPHYGHPEDDRHEPDEEEASQADPYVRVFPDESGYFRTPPMAVNLEGRRFRRMPPPTFFLSFVNEQGTIYAAGERYSAFQYRTFDASTKEEVPREEACWRIFRGTYAREGRGGQELMLFIGPNFDSAKPCLPSGSFTPGGFAPYKPLED